MGNVKIDKYILIYNKNYNISHHNILSMLEWDDKKIKIYFKIRNKDINSHSMTLKFISLEKSKRNEKIKKYFWRKIRSHYIIFK